MSQSFEVAGGNGRLYRLTQEEKDKELARLAGLVERGQSWATPDKLHDYSGFLQVTQFFIDWLQAAFDAQDAENMRMNWKGFVAESVQGSKFLKVQDAWIGGRPSLPAFIDSQKPAPAPAGCAVAKGSMAQRQDQEPEDQEPEDDLPF